MTIRITQKGRERVKSLEFAEELRDFRRAWTEEGKPEEEGQRMIVAIIAATLAGETATEATPSEKAAFVNDHLGGDQRSD